MNQDSVKTEIKEGSHDEFIHFLFGQEPKEKDSIQLEIPDIPKDKNVHLHIYEQLLQIFVDGLKYFYSNDEGKVDVTKLSIDNITKIRVNYNTTNDIIKPHTLNTLLLYFDTRIITSTDQY